MRAVARGVGGVPPAVPGAGTDGSLQAHQPQPSHLPRLHRLPRRGRRCPCLLHLRRNSHQALQLPRSPDRPRRLSLPPPEISIAPLTDITAIHPIVGGSIGRLTEILEGQVVERALGVG